MLGCRPTSTSLGESIHIEQSLVGKVLSSWAIWPPMVGASLHQVNPEAGSAEIEGGLNTADPSTNNHDVSEIIALRGILRQLLDILLQHYYVFHFLSPRQIFLRP